MKFAILGNQNAITYKEVFPYIKENIIWLGASIHSGGVDFRLVSFLARIPFHACIVRKPSSPEPLFMAFIINNSV